MAANLNPAAVSCDTLKEGEHRKQDMKKTIGYYLLLYLYPIWGLLIAPLNYYHYTQQLLKTYSASQLDMFLYYGGLAVLIAGFVLSLYCFFIKPFNMKRPCLIIAMLEVVVLMIPFVLKSSGGLYSALHTDLHYNFTIAVLILAQYLMLFVSQKEKHSKDGE